MTEVLSKLYEIVERQSKNFDKLENVCDGQTWNYHLLPVIENSIMFAKMYNGNTEVVEIAALFHDYANLVDFEKYSEVHHIASGELAEPILLEHGYEMDFIEKVKKCIFSHRASVLKEKFSVEEVCLADGDAVTHIKNAFQIIMWMGQSGKSVEEGNRFAKNKLKKSFNKLSDKSKEYIKEHYDAVMKIFY